jgi:hypothetical protein
MFRQQLVRDSVNDIFMQQSLEQFRLGPDLDLDYGEIDRIARRHATDHNLPYVTVKNIQAHHWIPGNYEVKYSVYVDPRLNPVPLLKVIGVLV